MGKLKEKDLAEMEALLGFKLPDDVQLQYLKSNGFRGPTGCQMLYAFNSNEDTEIVRINKFIKSEEWFPEELSKLVIFGDDGCGGSIGFDYKLNSAVLWYTQDGAEYQETKNTVTEIWQEIESLYE